MPAVLPIHSNTLELRCKSPRGQWSCVFLQMKRLDAAHVGVHERKVICIQAADWGNTTSRLADYSGPRCAGIVTRDSRARPTAAKGFMRRAVQEGQEKRNYDCDPARMEQRL